MSVIEQSGLQSRSLLQEDYFPLNAAHCFLARHSEGQVSGVHGITTLFLRRACEAGRQFNLSIMI